MLTIINILTTIILCRILPCIPVIPYFKVRALEKNKLKYNLIMDFIGIIIIGGLSRNLTFSFVNIYFYIINLLIGYIYFFGKKHLKMIDNYFISVLLYSMLVFYPVLVEYITTFPIILNYMIQNGVSGEVIAILKNQNEIFIGREIEFSVLIIGFFMFIVYYILDKKNYNRWEVSYLWLLPYVILFFLDRYGDFNTPLIHNFMIAFKTVYIVYFFKIISVFFKRIGFRYGLNMILSFMFINSFPETSFVLGGLASGIVVRIIRIK